MAIGTSIGELGTGLQGTGLQGLGLQGLGLQRAGLQGAGPQGSGPQSLTLQGLGQAGGPRRPGQAEMGAGAGVFANEFRSQQAAVLPDQPAFGVGGVLPTLPKGGTSAIASLVPQPPGVPTELASGPVRTGAPHQVPAPEPEAKPVPKPVFVGTPKLEGTPVLMGTPVLVGAPHVAPASMAPTAPAQAATGTAGSGSRASGARGLLEHAVGESGDASSILTKGALVAAAGASYPLRIGKKSKEAGGALRSGEGEQVAQATGMSLPVAGVPTAVMPFEMGAAGVLSTAPLLGAGGGASVGAVKLGGPVAVVKPGVGRGQISKGMTEGARPHPEGHGAGKGAPLGESNGVATMQGATVQGATLPAPVALVPGGGVSSGSLSGWTGSTGWNATAGVTAAGSLPGAKAGLAPHAEFEGTRRETYDGSGVHATSGGATLSDPQTLVATPHVLEVGITGGAHGWLRVRAELEHTGEVTASLVASNAASADALHKELGAMSAYLKSESLGVSSLAVAAPESGSATPSAGSQPGSQLGKGGGLAGGGMAGGGSADAGGGMAGGGMAGGAEGAGRDGRGSSSPWSGPVSAASRFAARHGIDAMPASMLGAASGGWLSVRV